MAESSSHNPSSPKITPKEEHVTLDKPKSPNPFLPAYHIKFTFDEIAFTTNNEVALLYPLHPNLEYFREVSDFISKCCLKEAFTRAPTQYKEYLCEFWYTAKTLDNSKIWVSTPTGGIRGDIGINTFRNALRAHYLPHSSMYVSPPSIAIVRPWFTTIGGKIGGLDQISNKDATILYNLANGVKVDYAKQIWEDIINKLNKKTREKVVPYLRFISLLLEYMMPEYNNEELTINPTQVFSVHNWALKPNQTEGPPFTNRMKAIYNLDAHIPQLKLILEILLLMIPYLHNRTKFAEDGLKTSHTDSGTNKESRADEISKKIKLEDLSDLLKDTRSAFFTFNSLQDEPIIISDESEEKDVEKDDTHATSHDVPKDTSIPHPPSPKSAQI
ncbi:hypothetical protein Tco_1002271 [Tanacetum coccineum]|uniref:Rho-GAP domain-containing protein n=1 Tax=Tanacetum coccineum TaxID=301880 RepID=A0ABQ5F5U6_9ASTR